MQAASLVPGAVAALASLAVACWVLQLWDTSLNVPWGMGREDLWSVLLYMKTTLEQTWPTHNQLLGAPFGQDLQDYPLGDAVQILLTKLIGLFSGDVAVVTNLFFLVTFPLTALSALWALRRLGASTWIAVACAVIFAVAPYHFFRSEDHLLIAAYYTVPFSAYLILTQLAGDVPSARTTVVLAVLIGAAFTYYALFTLILLAFAVLVSLARGRRAAAARGGLALATIGVALAVTHAPTWIYTLEHGRNQAVARLHSDSESERYALKIPEMVFPVQKHRIGPLADLRHNLDVHAPEQLEEGSPQALGLLTTLGFVALVWLALTALVPRRAGVTRDPQLDAAATATIATLVLGLAGGAALVFAYSGSPIVRSWSRLSILIAFFSLLAVAKGLDHIQQKLTARGVRPLVLGAALAAVVAVASVEQTSSAMVPDYAANATTWRSDAAFTARLAMQLPRDSVVFQLPYVPFPEAYYFEARPYLHTDRLRWTFGAMSGRPADWTASLAGLPVKEVASSAAAAGASAIFLVRDAYPDDGRAVAAGLQALLGPPIAVNDLRTFEVYDLRRFRAALQSRLGAPAFGQLRELTLHPVQVLPASDLSLPVAPTGSYATYSRSSFSPTAVLDLVNPEPRRRAVTIDIRVTTLSAARQFEIRMPDGGRAAFAANPTANGRGTVTLQPGHNRLTLRAFTPEQPARTRYFSIDRVAIQDEQVAGILTRAG